MENRRRAKNYFKSAEGAPGPIVVEVERRVHFNEVDLLGIVWHGRYPVFFEEGSEELGRVCGLSYKDFYESGLRAPIAQLYIDYLKPLRLGEVFKIRAVLVWDESSRINTEYYLLKEDGRIATSGYTVQVLTAAATGEVCIISPPLLERCRTRWKAGEFHRR
ncbi:MAG: acyl-CoA thioesterase [Nitrospirae bacterium]|nr:acyl-CoA thioesterase [Nitrospirota bacterium]